MSLNAAITLINASQTAAGGTQDNFFLPRSGTDQGFWVGLAASSVPAGASISVQTQIALTGDTWQTIATQTLAAPGQVSTPIPANPALLGSNGRWLITITGGFVAATATVAAR